MRLHDWRSEIHHLLPDFAPAVEQATYQQLAWVGQVISNPDLGAAAHLIANQAVNDLLDLLGDLQVAAGRSAMRAARSLVEDAINLRTVLSGHEAEERYLAHLDQGPVLLQTMAPGEDLLIGTRRKAYRHSLDKVGNPARGRFRAAVARYGGSFRRAWTPETLADRAQRFGLDDLYAFYKVASLVAHGSAGGTIGIRREHEYGITHRTGPAIELAPTAMWGGLRAYKQVVIGMEHVLPDLDAESWTSGIDELLALWPGYQSTLEEIDRRLWPIGPARGPEAVFAYTQTGKTRWYQHLPMFGILVEANEPELPPQQKSALERVVAEQPRPDNFSDTQRWATAFVAGATVTPKRKGRIIPSTALMSVPPSEGWRYERLDD